jgi:hypothetical protein
VVCGGERREETSTLYFVGGKVEPRISRWVPEARKRASLLAGIWIWAGTGAPNFMAGSKMFEFLRKC